jgi:hypothetical protein
VLVWPDVFIGCDVEFANLFFTVFHALPLVVDIDELFF